jgi:hypothetical protein
VSTPHPNEPVAFGLTKTYGDGLQVMVSKGTTFTPSQYAVGVSGGPWPSRDLILSVHLDRFADSSRACHYRFRYAPLWLEGARRFFLTVSGSVHL